MEVRVEDGRLILDPVTVVPRTLRLTVSSETKEAEVDEDIRRRLTEAESAAALLVELDG